MTQQYLARQHPGSVAQTGKHAEQAAPERQDKQKQGAQCQRLRQEIRRQQLP